ncbi:MAG: aspartate carbamoyltransferase catalytic subunit [Phycisphaerales bacterium]
MSQPTRTQHDSRTEPGLRPRHLLSVDPLTRRDLEAIIDLALSLKATDEPRGDLAGLTLANLFFEPSTRTRASFEQAARRLGADVLNLDMGASSVVKGESLVDTLHTIESVGARFVAMRHASSGVHEFAAPHLTTASLLNAGDGRHQHPTQALLDCVTLCEKLGSIEGKTIAIVGDILHSRVARSNIAAFSKLGARVRLVGPRTMLPRTIVDAFGVDATHELAEGVRGADAVYLLRIQLERQERAIYGSGGAYHRQFGLSTKRLDELNPGAIVMHPGPVNPGVEMTAELMTSARSLIRAQVTNGVFARMAAMLWLCGKGAS